MPRPVSWPTFPRLHHSESPAAAWIDSRDVGAKSGGASIWAGRQRLGVAGGVGQADGVRHLGHQSGRSYTARHCFHHEEEHSHLPDQRQFGWPSHQSSHPWFSRRCRRLQCAVGIQLQWQSLWGFDSWDNRGRAKVPQAGGIVANRSVPHQAARHPCALEPVVNWCKSNYFLLIFFVEKVILNHPFFRKRRQGSSSKPYVNSRKSRCDMVLSDTCLNWLPE